jgi:inner membrane protein
MASTFGHSIVAFTISKAINNKHSKPLVLLAIVSSILPDLDIVSFSLGISYEHPFGHRGFLHSIIFAILWALLIMVFVAKKNKLIWFFVIFLSTVSHGILDAMTSGGRGVGFFIPLNNDRYFFPFRGIKVSPIGIKDFFSEWGIHVILSELKYIVVPCIIVLLILKLIRKRFK